MKNSLRTKTLFFSTYWNQDIVHRYDKLYSVDVALNEINIEDAYLLLRPISSMTNEEMIEYFDFLYDRNRSEFSKIQSIKSDILSDKIFNQIMSIAQSIKATDYLRSRGFAVPYFDISIKELIDYKWIVLK